MVERVLAPGACRCREVEGVRLHAPAVLSGGKIVFNWICCLVDAAVAACPQAEVVT
jgi:hypothetical protein